MGPMHEMTASLAVTPGVRERLQASWLRTVGSERAPMPLTQIAESPLVMSERLHSEVNARVADLCTWIQSKVAAGEWASDPRWPGVDAPDALAADLAIVHDPESPDGWGLRWVEFQAFHSLAASLYGIHLAALEEWPQLAGMAPFELPAGSTDWLQATRDWIAPTPAGVLLEHAPYAQGTAFDLVAASKLWGLDLVEPGDLRTVDGRLQRGDRGAWEDVPHVFNRLILHEDTAWNRTQEVLSAGNATWRGHPAWFERIHKGLLPELPSASRERCARADRWRELGLPASALVLKSTLSWGGAAVRLDVTEEELDALAAQAESKDWIVQPRFTSYPVSTASDGTPVHAELRCLIALEPGKQPWLAGRLARLFRTGTASAKAWTGKPGEGMAPVYAPPAAYPEVAHAS
ncbi:hypothetical protein ABIC83_002935 [Roseateles asaccharophilus]|uniref:hypothetical protein n=1 Tax=Roseateles asaccharophilus TaxID=582607 RepID=UPI00383772C1